MFFPIPILPKYGGLKRKMTFPRQYLPVYVRQSQKKKKNLKYIFELKENYSISMISKFQLRRLGLQLSSADIQTGLGYYILPGDLVFP